MKNHTLMQTIARANRVFPEKDNGLIVDYVGVFRNLEKALAIYGAASAGESPIEIIDALGLDPRPANGTKLVGSDGWRIRVGDYRVVYAIDDSVRVVSIVEVGRRRDVYER